jgi:hypothetical protein
MKEGKSTNPGRIIEQKIKTIRRSLLKRISTFERRSDLTI